MALRAAEIDSCEGKLLLGLRFFVGTSIGCYALSRITFVISQIFYSLNNNLYEIVFNLY